MRIMRICLNKTLFKCTTSPVINGHPFLVILNKFHYGIKPEISKKITCLIIHFSRDYIFGLIVKVIHNDECNGG